MAIQKDTKYIGTVGNLIFYKWMDIYCIRTVPANVRRTEPSKQAALNFGKVSSRSKMLRQSFDHFIAAPRDKEMQKRLKKSLLESIHFTETGEGEMPNHPLKGFRFNEALSIEQLLGFNLNISERPGGNYELEVPEINPFSLIKAPVGTSRVQLEIKGFSFSFDHDRTSNGTAVTLTIPYVNETQPAFSAKLKTLYEKPCVVLFAARLSYWNQDVRIAPPGYNPAEVIAVFKY